MISSRASKHRLLSVKRKKMTRILTLIWLDTFVEQA